MRFCSECRRGVSLLFLIYPIRNGACVLGAFLARNGDKKGTHGALTVKGARGHVEVAPEHNDSIHILDWRR
jgi:hypothetical protein